MFVNVPNLEIFVISSGPAAFERHWDLCFCYIVAVSDLLLLPTSLSEQDHSKDRNGRFSNRDCCKHSFWSERGAEREEVCNRNLKQPIAEDIYHGRGERIA